MASKTLGVFIILIFIALATAFTFQYLEMESYGLPATLKERFFPEKAEVPAADAEVPQESAENEAIAE